MEPLELARWQFGITTVYHFIFVPLTISLSFLVAGPADRVGAHRQREVPAGHEVLRQVVPDQLRHGRRDRHRAGVPVRHELVGLLPLRGRHLRGPAGHRGAADVLPRIHVPGAVDLRLGPAAQAGPPGHHLGGGGRDGDERLHDPGRQRLDAAPGGLRVQRRPQPGRADGLPRRDVPEHRRRRLAPHHGRGLRVRRRVPGGRQPVPADARQGRGHGADHAAARAPSSRSSRACGTVGDRRHGCQDHGRAAAHEDGGRRGACTRPASSVPFSLFTIGTLDGTEEVCTLGVPGLASFLATGSFDGTVEGINDLNEQYQAEYGEQTGVHRLPARTSRSPTGPSGS